MSYTVLIDEQERERRFENRLNAVVRHCRVGKVSRKVKESALLPGHIFSPFTGIAAPARPDWFTQMGIPFIHNMASA